MEKIFESDYLEPEEIDSIVLVGGSSRIPWLRNYVYEMFGKEADTMLNPDEAVA